MEELGLRYRLTQMTLAEQLKITDREIASRKALLDFTQDDVDHLVACKPLVQAHIDETVDEFYARLTAFAEAQLVIGDAETFRRLHGSMRKYVAELFDGFYDQEYVDKRLRIGKVHMRIGVSPKLYIAAINLLETVLLSHLEADDTGSVDQALMLARRSALRKLLMLDVQFVFDTYIATLVSEVQDAKGTVEKYAESLEETVAERTRQLEMLSRTDPLTGLANKRACVEHLHRELAGAERGGEAITLVFFDLNGFKGLNDSRGHATGDSILEVIGRCLQAVVRKSDIACRFGGDEFCIIMPNTHAEEAEKVCRRLTDRLDQQDIQGVTLSIGIAQAGPEVFPDMDSLLRTADASMYEAKAQTRNAPGHQISRAATLRSLASRTS